MLCSHGGPLASQSSSFLISRYTRRRLSLPRRPGSAISESSFKVGLKLPPFGSCPFRAIHRRKMARLEAAWFGPLEHFERGSILLTGDIAIVDYELIFGFPMLADV